MKLNLSSSGTLGATSLSLLEQPIESYLSSSRRLGGTNQASSAEPMRKLVEVELSR